MRYKLFLGKLLPKNIRIYTIILQISEVELVSKKIVFVGGYPNAKDVNLYVFFRNLVHAIADLGVECHVVSPVSLTKYRASVKSIPRHKEEKTQNGSRVFVHHPRYLSFSQKQIGPVNTMKYTHKCYLSAALKETKKLGIKFDAAYGHFFFSGGLAAVHIGKNLNIPSFIAYGESSYEVMVRGKKVAITKDSISALSGIISVSTKNTDELKNEDVYRDIPIFTCPNAIDLSLFPEYNKEECREYFGIPKDDFVVGFVGGFSERKGDKRVLEACKNLDDVSLTFAGYGDPPVGDNVVFCKSVEHGEIGKFLSCLDVFVLPTLNEGCCNAILEAMASGCAIVSSSLPFNDDIIDDTNSIKINPISIDEIREAVIRLKQDDDFRLKISQKAKEDSHNFTIEKRAEKILGFMSNFMKK